MRTIVLAMVTIVSISTAAYADETWKAGDISCKAETVGNNGLEMITGERGSVISIGRHMPRTSTYEWSRTLDMKNMSKLPLDLIKPCAEARPVGS